MVSWPPNHQNRENNHSYVVIRYWIRVAVSTTGERKGKKKGAIYWRYNLDIYERSDSDSRIINGRTYKFVQYIFNTDAGGNRGLKLTAKFLLENIKWSMIEEVILLIVRTCIHWISKVEGRKVTKHFRPSRNGRMPKHLLNFDYI